VGTPRSTPTSFSRNLPLIRCGPWPNSRTATPNSGHYGFGWFIENKKGHHVVEHEGAWQGFETVISRYPDDKLTVVVLTNLESAEPSKFADMRRRRMYLSGKVK